MNPYMPVTTRHQFGNDNHTPFIFKQLETPPKCPCKQTCVEDPKSIQTQTANIWHNPLYSFKNPFRTPFETPQGANSLVTMVHPDEVQCRIDKQAHEDQKILDAIYAREREQQ